MENCLREDLKPIEQAQAFRALMDRRGWSYRQLGRALNLVVCPRLAGDGPAGAARGPARRGSTAGELAASVAYELSRIDDPEEQRRRRRAGRRGGADSRPRSPRSSGRRRGPAKGRGGQGRTAEAPDVPDRRRQGDGRAEAGRFARGDRGGAGRGHGAGAGGAAGRGGLIIGERKGSRAIRSRLRSFGTPLLPIPIPCRRPGRSTSSSGRPGPGRHSHGIPSRHRPPPAPRP